MGKNITDSSEFNLHKLKQLGVLKHCLKELYALSCMPTLDVYHCFIPSLSILLSSHSHTHTHTHKHTHTNHCGCWYFTSSCRRRDSVGHAKLYVAKRNFHPYMLAIDLHTTATFDQLATSCESRLTVSFYESLCLHFEKRKRPSIMKSIWLPHDCHMTIT